MKKKTPKVKNQPQTRLVLPKIFNLTLLLSCAGIAVSFAIRNNLPPEIPLFYGLAEGEDQLAPSSFIFLPAGIGFIVLLLNTIISLILKSQYLKKVLIGSAFAVNTLTIITTVKIILLVGSL